MTSWAPTLEDVAGCIPTRTANVNLPGDDEYLNTFNDDTRPNSTEAQKAIDHAVTDALSVVTSIPTALEDIAKNAVMWRAAADIELAYPDRNADANYYAQLDARARYEWDRFIKASEGQNSSTEVGVPTWQFPTPVWYGDRNDI